MLGIVSPFSIMPLSNPVYQTSLKYLNIYCLLWLQLLQLICKKKDNLISQYTTLSSVFCYKICWWIELSNNLKRWVACFRVKSNGYQVFRNYNHVPLLHESLCELQFYWQIVAFQAICWKIIKLVSYTAIKKWNRKIIVDTNITHTCCASCCVYSIRCFPIPPCLF